MDKPHTQQAPECTDRAKRIRRDVKNGETEDGRPATIEVYSGFQVNESPATVEGSDDSVFAEKVNMTSVSLSLSLSFSSHMCEHQ